MPAITVGVARRRERCQLVRSAPFPGVCDPISVGIRAGGNCVGPHQGKTGWLLLYDYCMSNRYGISSSPDLIRWSIEEPVSLPPDARHGSVVPLAVAEAAALRSSFPDKKD